MAELNKVTQDEKDEYNMIQAEIAGLDDMTEDQLREMCERMDAEEKQREKDQLKHNQWLKVSRIGWFIEGFAQDSSIFVSFSTRIGYFN